MVFIKQNKRQKQQGWFNKKKKSLKLSLFWYCHGAEKLTKRKHLHNFHGSLWHELGYDGSFSKYLFLDYCFLVGLSYFYFENSNSLYTDVTSECFSISLKICAVQV